MKKYLAVAGNSLQEYFAYRMNFLLWRVRVIVSLLISFYLWRAVYQVSQSVFGYKIGEMLTYIFLTVLVSGIVFSGRTAQVAVDINYGSLSTYLIRPVNYIFYNLARDFSDKVINTVFSVAEICIIIFILKPQIIMQTQPVWIALFLGAVTLSLFLYFEIGMILSFIGFWSKETWAPRFIFSILVSFLAGSYFPLDIIPRALYRIIEFTPFPYLLYFPVKMYLGKANPGFIISGFMLAVIWLIVLFFVMRWLWKKGLKTYTSEGQ
jgi:ABC-2 type transport system permease protein